MGAPTASEQRSENPVAGSQPHLLARALSWLAVAVGVLAALGALSAATYGHQGGSAFDSAWVQWGQTGVAALAWATAIYSTQRTTSASRAAIALVGLVIASTWMLMVVAGIS